MKKLLIFLICFLLVCPLLCSCGKSQGGGLTEPTQGQSDKEEELTHTEPTSAGEKGTTVSGVDSTTRREAEKSTGIEVSVPSAKELKVKYIRDYSGDYEAPASAVIIRSAAELEARYRGSREELEALCDEYTRDYFKTGVLLIATVTESSGSTTHRVTGVDNNGGELCVNVKAETPEVGTCDMASWQIIVEYPLGDYSGITVNKT